jgi:hypothetical protein
LARVRDPSSRSSQPVGDDEGPADGTKLGILVADGRAEGATVGPAEGTLLGATVGPVEGALLGPAVGTAGAFVPELMVGVWVSTSPPTHSQAKAMVYSHCIKPKASIHMGGASTSSPWKSPSRT